MSSMLLHAPKNILLCSFCGPAVLPELGLWLQTWVCDLFLSKPWVVSQEQNLEEINHDYMFWLLKKPGSSLFLGDVAGVGEEQSKNVSAVCALAHCVLTVF